MRLRLAAGLLLAVSGTALGAQPDPVLVDAKFRQALGASAQGDLLTAEALLRQLAEATQAPRIKLELAVILQRLGRDREALDLFREVYRARGTSPAVRRNIATHIDEIELRTAKVRLGLDVITDSNPFGVSDSFTLWFGNIPLEYNPPKPKEMTYGVEPWVSVEKAWASGVSAKLRGSVRVFEDSELNSFQVYSSFTKRMPQMTGLFVQGNLDARLQQGGSYLIPSVDVWKVTDVAPTVRVGIGGHVGYLFADTSAASGVITRPFVFADWSAATDLQFYARVSYEQLNAWDSYYSYESPRVEVGSTTSFSGISLSPQLSAAQTRYRQENPFFGLVRRDTFWRASVTMSYDKISIRGITPELTVFHEERDSNIPLYSYAQDGAFLRIRNYF